MTKLSLDKASFVDTLSSSTKVYSKKSEFIPLVNFVAGPLRRIYASFTGQKTPSDKTNIMDPLLKKAKGTDLMESSIISEQALTSNEDAYPILMDNLHSMVADGTHYSRMIISAFRCYTLGTLQECADYAGDEHHPVINKSALYLSLVGTDKVAKLAAIRAYYFAHQEFLEILTHTFQDNIKTLPVERTFSSLEQFDFVTPDVDNFIRTLKEITQYYRNWRETRSDASQLAVDTVERSLNYPPTGEVTLKHFSDLLTKIRTERKSLPTQNRDKIDTKHLGQLLTECTKIIGSSSTRFALMLISALECHFHVPLAAYIFTMQQNPIITENKHYKEVITLLQQEKPEVDLVSCLGAIEAYHPQLYVQILKLGMHFIALQHLEPLVKGERKAVAVTATPPIPIPAIGTPVSQIAVSSGSMPSVGSTEIEPGLLISEPFFPDIPLQSPTNVTGTMFASSRSASPTPKPASPEGSGLFCPQLFESPNP